MKNETEQEVDSLDEMFENEKPPIRVHKTLSVCESCEG
jgi:hypothetical protein